MQEYQPLITTEGNTMVSYLNPRSVDKDLNRIGAWENVTEKFKTEFRIAWKKAYKILNSEYESNIGANMICVLNDILNKLNSSRLDRNVEFSTVCDQVIQEYLNQ